MPAGGNHPCARTSLFLQPVKLGTPDAHERSGIPPAGTINEKDLCLTQGSSSHYQVLGIPVTATEKDIKVAYRKAARTAHPDHGGDPAAFRRVTLAYETLIDTKRRADYDRSYGSASGGAYSSPAGDEGAHFDAPAAGSRASANVRRPNTPRNTAADPPVYVPPFEQFDGGSAVPLIPASVGPAAGPRHAPQARHLRRRSPDPTRDAHRAAHQQADPDHHPGGAPCQRAAVPGGQQPHRPRGPCRVPSSRSSDPCSCRRVPMHGTAAR